MCVEQAAAVGRRAGRQRAGGEEARCALGIPTGIASANLWQRRLYAYMPAARWKRTADYLGSVGGARARVAYGALRARAAPPPVHVRSEE